PRIKRVRQAADLMLDLEKGFVAIEIDDVLPAVLVGVALLGQQLAFLQLFIRAGEVADIDLDVVSVIGRNLSPGLAEPQLLIVADADAGGAARAVAFELGLRAENLPVELLDPSGGPGRHLEFEIGHAEIDRAEPLDIRAVHVEAVAP